MVGAARRSAWCIARPTSADRRAQVSPRPAPPLLCGSCSWPGLSSRAGGPVIWMPWSSPATADGYRVRVSGGPDMCCSASRRKTAWSSSCPTTTTSAGCRRCWPCPAIGAGWSGRRPESGRRASWRRRPHRSPHCRRPSNCRPSARAGRSRIIPATRSLGPHRPAVGPHRRGPGGGAATATSARATEDIAACRAALRRWLRHKAEQDLGPWSAATAQTMGMACGRAAFRSRAHALGQLLGPQYDQPQHQATLSAPAVGPLRPGA